MTELLRKVVAEIEKLPEEKLLLKQLLPSRLKNNEPQRRKERKGRGRIYR
ncbi:hypothetical protein NIES4071_13120 [Calothrix sp. NIES-4071]|nr:hypothetical protein NIES4071_13120 [Calothrix sp. NIES-4071]BAZ55652.1 hypothetical protein NIES4105_13080 [Calothrix sp. NIES-4105]